MLTEDYAITLRPAIAEDFEYCNRLYFTEMRRIIEELNLDRVAQEVGFRQQWELTEVRIILLDGLEVGWLQTAMQEEGLFIGQLFVDGPFQQRGIGTRVINGLIGEAASVNQAVLLTVAKTNPALRLYQRLGFAIIHEDSRKFYLKRDCDPPSRRQMKS